MANIGILNLPQTDTVVGGDLFIVQQNNVTKQISFDNLLFGLDNASFSSTISAHSTEISFLSTSLYTLSAQNTAEYDYLTNLITTQINLAFTNLSLALYPISSIKCTSDNVNPGFYIKNTIWKLVGQGQYMAGAGHTYQNGSPYTNGDKNRDNEFFYPGGNLAAAATPSNTDNIYYVGFQPQVASTPNIGAGTISYKSGFGPTNFGGYSYQTAVWVVATANTGFTFDSWTVYNPNGSTFNDIDTSVAGELSFYMPPNNVVIVAKFTNPGTPTAGVYYVSLSSNPPQGGSCYFQTDYGPSVDGGYNTSTPVVIEGAPNPGYQLLNFTVTPGPSNIDRTKAGEVSFYMPSTNVWVTANYGVLPANNLGEYNAGIVNAQIPAHTHDFQIHLQTTNSANSYQNGPQAAPAWRLDTTTTFTTLSNVTTDVSHNNNPPIYGTYMWMRIA